MQLETKRLVIREMREKDFAPLYPILSDPETMRYYPAPFDQAKSPALDCSESGTVQDLWVWPLGGCP